MKGRYSDKSTSRFPRGAWVGTALGLLALLLSVAPSAGAAEEPYLFNATLSLSGGCAISSVDPVPDPGTCPMPPGQPGIDHPSKPFKLTRGNAVDSYGDRYIASYGQEGQIDTEGRIDVFGPDGRFITEIEDPNGPISLAVDSEGNLYAMEQRSGGEPNENLRQISRYSPTAYEPATGTIEYGSPVVFMRQEEPHGNPPVPEINGGNALVQNGAVAVDPLNDHLLVKVAGTVNEYTSAAEGNNVVGPALPEARTYPFDQEIQTIAVDGAHDRLLVLVQPEQNLHPGATPALGEFELSGAHAQVGEIDGSTTPAGQFAEVLGMSVAADEATGNIFVSENYNNKRIYEFEPDGTYVTTITKKGLETANIFPQLSIDNGPHSPNQGVVYFPSGEGNPGHSLAFEPYRPPRTPAVESAGVSGVTEDEAILRAEINTEGAEASYRLQYVTQQGFEAEGFDAALTAAEGELPAATDAVAVHVPIAGLSAGVAYRFRVVVADEAGSDERQVGFTTYSETQIETDCENQSLRTGPSARLPDCRAYELVTPANTNGHSPFAGSALGEPFETEASAANGRALYFIVEGGALPGYEGTGSFAGDPYLATRTPSGWVTAAVGPTGAEALGANFGGLSADLGYSPWEAEAGGSKVVGRLPTRYVRYPDGHSALVGRGSLGTDPRAKVRYISEGGTHIIFESAAQLEPQAPPPLENIHDQGALYDRTGDEVTHVVSLLPGDETPSQADGNAMLEGVSKDGSAVAFRLYNTPGLWVRVDDRETIQVGGAGATSMGLNADGSRIFYTEAGNLYALDLASGATVAFTEAGDAVTVNISADGTAAYFLSHEVLPVNANPQGALPQPGGENLYLSKEGALSFVGTVSSEDLVDSLHRLDGWGEFFARGELVRDPSRTTASGSVVVFESKAQLTSYDSAGHSEIYRYDAQAPSLRCLSCDPTQAAPQGGATLASIRSRGEAGEPLLTYNTIRNLASGGNRVVFQSPDPLVVGDTDNAQDVYEWEADGVGSCTRPNGCVYLLSSGRSAHGNYLFAVSADGNDVFISTTDLLLPALDSDNARSVYDVRVNGGIPGPGAPAAGCLGAACQPVGVPPATLNPASALFHGPGNVSAPRSKKKHCAKGKRRKRRHGHVRCLAVHRHRKHHRKHHHRKHQRQKQRARHGASGRAGR